jgi:putative phosphoribosyl transferase
MFSTSRSSPTGSAKPRLGSVLSLLRVICLWGSSARAPARRRRSSRRPGARMCGPSSAEADAPDLAGSALENVSTPTLLIVGGHDLEALALNRSAYRRLHCQRRLEMVPGATHLFEEPGTVESVVALARAWSPQRLAPITTEPNHDVS